MLLALCVDPFLVRPGVRVVLVNAIAEQPFWRQLVLDQVKEVDGCVRSVGCGPVARTHHVLVPQNQPKTVCQNQG